MTGSTTVLRTRTRMVGLCLVLALALAVAWAASASASSAGSKPRKPHVVDMALGDQLAFGYSLPRYNKLRKYVRKGKSVPESGFGFENGYANAYYHAIKAKEKPTQTYERLENLGCPRETSASLIGNGPVGEYMASHLEATTESPCAYEQEWLNEQAAWEAAGWNEKGYGGPPHLVFTHDAPTVEASQLEEALKRIAADSNDGEGHTATPVTIVTLDVGTADEEKLVATCGETEPGNPECVASHAGAVAEQITKNVADIVYVLRNADTLFPSDHYINYAGPIVFVAGYDPYGVLVAGQGEKVSHSNEMLANLTTAEKAALEGQPKTCLANVQPAFNPAFSEGATEAVEAERLKKWTGMDPPGTKTMFGKTYGFENGPDPSPTRAGYREMAALIEQACKYPAEQ